MDYEEFTLQYDDASALKMRRINTAQRNAYYYLPTQVPSFQIRLSHLRERLEIGKFSTSVIFTLFLIKLEA